MVARVTLALIVGTLPLVADIRADASERRKQILSPSLQSPQKRTPKFKTVVPRSRAGENVNFSNTENFWSGSFNRPARKKR